MNNKETQISNMSYTNKDFNSIYSELLDTAKSLTNKWDPSQSNESDPGVVLIKEDAIIGDKNNYNIDKNVLELFPLSVTQTGNARKIYDFAGYQMHWYRAANTVVSIRYSGDFPLQSGTSNKLPITVPYGTEFVNEDGSIVYTYVENDYSEDSPLLSDGDRIGALYCLQGALQEYDVNGSTAILFSNLDSERRLFFPYQNVAENGIFIKTQGTNARWTKVNNLESQPVGSLVFKFGVMPNTNVCYVQFPQDIEYLIGEGLSIKYLTTLGENGNVKAGVINRLSGDVEIQVGSEEVTLNNDNVVLSNKDATSSGKDPESLDEAYENYKKTVGTFETLVSCKDYENALYNSETVSNCVVSDRTNDMNATWNTMEVKGLDSYSVNKVQSLHYNNEAFDPEVPLYIKDGYVSDFNVSGSTKTISYTDLSMSAFDLVLYLLQPVKNVNSAYEYNKTFTKTIEDESLLGDAVTYLNKSCQHNFKDPREVLDNTVVENASNDTVAVPYIFKNFYTLKGTLITYSKVNKEEAQDIEDNVRLALYKRFNARNVNFGEALLYEDIVNTIKNADSRIKSITLNEDLDYDLRGLKYNDGVGGIESSIDEEDAAFSSAKITALVKMILRGTVPLYNFNEDFVMNFGETSAEINGAEGWQNDPTASGSNQFSKYIESITTSVTINKDVSTDSFIIDDPNVNIILYTDNYIDKTTYTYYATVKNNLSEAVPTGQLVKLGGNVPNALEVSWKDENNIKKTQSIPSNTVVEIKIDGKTEIASGDTESLGVSGTLVVKELNQDNNSLKSGVNFIYFTNVYTYNPDTNEYTFTLMNGNESERVLGVDEYLIYTNKARDELVILGSGTKISRPTDNMSSEISYTTTLTPNIVISEGTAVMEQISWQELSYGLTVTELKIVTIGSGYRFYTDQGVTFYDGSDNPTSGDTIVKQPQHVDGESGLYYANVDDPNDSTAIPASPSPWYIFSRLNVQAAPDIAQSLTSDEEVVLNIKDLTTTPVSMTQVSLTNCKFKTNRASAIVGGDNISALVTHVDESGIVHDYSLKVLDYTEASLDPDPLTSPYFKQEEDGTYIVNTESAAGTTNITLPVSSTFCNMFKMDVTKASSGGAYIVTSLYDRLGNLSLPTYNQNTTYFPGDYVKYNLSSPVYTNVTFVCIKQTQGHAPSTTSQYWKPMGFLYDTSQVFIAPIGTAKVVIRVPVGVSMRIGKLYVVEDASIEPTNTKGLSREVRGSLNAMPSGAYTMFNTTYIDAVNEYNFDELYQVKDEDRIDTSALMIDDNGDYDIFQPSALWDVNHIWNRFTIPQMNTKYSTIKVSKSSRK